MSESHLTSELVLRGKKHRDYKGKVDIYKVNTENNQEMSVLFGIRSVPTLVMMSKNTKPVSIPGAPHKETLSEIIDAFLKEDKNFIRIEQEDDGEI